MKWILIYVVCLMAMFLLSWHAIYPELLGEDETTSLIELAALALSTLLAISRKK